ncbi:MAG: HPF/RaiA family ribosome-associated protein [Aquimonas sp.]|nr:HPF/RaiA family ribosome-associated protein [Aquimonas sp.]
MQINTYTQGFDLTDGLSQHLQRRLGFALGRLGGSVQRVVVRLCDVNGNRGGIDKRCRLQLRLASGGEVVVQDTRGDLYEAISAAIERAASALKRRSGRVRTLLRRGRSAAPDRFSRWPSEAVSP